MGTEIKYILELIRDKTITVDNGTERILNLFGVSVNEVEFCICGNETGSRFYDKDKKTIECVDCGKQIQN